MGDTVVHVEIYVLNLQSDNLREKLRIGYECLDDNVNMLFSPFLLRDCIRGHENIIPITPMDLRQRLSAFQLQSAVPPHILSKVENLIKYVENHLDIYAGIAVVYSE